MNIPNCGFTAGVQHTTVLTEPVSSKEITSVEALFENLMKNVEEIISQSPTSWNNPTSHFSSGSIRDFLQSPLESIPIQSIQTPADTLESFPTTPPVPVNTIQPSSDLFNIPPGALNDGPLLLNDLDLQLDADGSLSEQSKEQVNKLLSSLTEEIGGREVHGAVFQEYDSSLSLQLTPGETNRVEYRVPNNTVYSAHTHPGGSTTPSATDLQNQLPGIEDVLVVDGIGFTYA